MIYIKEKTILYSYGLTDMTKKISKLSEISTSNKALKRKGIIEKIIEVIKGKKSNTIPIHQETSIYAKTNSKPTLHKTHHVVTAHKSKKHKVLKKIKKGSKKKIKHKKGHTLAKTITKTTASTSTVPQVNNAPAYVNGNIVTDFDAVLNMVNTRGSISDTEIIKSLGLSKKEVEDCAKVLSDQNLIKVVYPILGGTKLVSLSYTKKPKAGEQK